HPRPAVLGRRAREHDVEVRDRCVRDPVLRAVDDPLVAVADRGGAHRGSSRSFISSDANIWIGSVPSSWIIRISALDAHARAISSTATWSISVPVPVPPYSAGS